MADIVLSTTKFVNNPLHQEFDFWVKQLIQSLPGYQVSLPPPEREWRGWASQFMLNNNFAEPLPTFSSYPTDDGWKKWFLFFIQVNPIFVVV